MLLQNQYLDLSCLNKGTESVKVDESRNSFFYAPLVRGDSLSRVQVVSGLHVLMVIF